MWQDRLTHIVPNKRQVVLCKSLNVHMEMSNVNLSSEEDVRIWFGSEVAHLLVIRVPTKQHMVTFLAAPTLIHTQVLYQLLVVLFVPSIPDAP
jgi:hypothetical protein